MLRNSFKLAFRNLLNQKQTTLISIIGLVISFSVILQIGSWAYNEMIYDRNNSKADRIYRFTIDENYPEYNFHWHFARTRQPWRNKLADFHPEIESLTEMRPMTNTTVKANTNLFETERSFAVDSMFFNIFDFDFIDGNAAEVLPPNTMVISECFAKKLFPNQDALYKKLELSWEKTNGFEKYTITGIFKDLPATSHFHADLLIHYIKKPVLKPVYRNDFAFTYLLLKKGTDIEQIKRRGEEFKKAHVPVDQQQNSTFYFTPLTDIHLKSHIEREMEPNGDINQVKLFLFIGLGMFLIALINYINLSIASFEKRSKCFYLNSTAGAKLNSRGNSGTGSLS
jgi:putative ABC transport system permease protein